ncbi:MAG: hypothetical protein H6765_10435 [Candidatus Peribacteria bacterium]|nr:MAG: hypothetical protein H6765_10435 [Candidatus Peribacteria bacterium]
MNQSVYVSCMDRLHDIEACVSEAKLPECSEKKIKQLAFQIQSLSDDQEVMML